VVAVVAVVVVVEARRRAHRGVLGLVAARLPNVEVLAGLACEDGRRRGPVIRGRDDQIGKLRVFSEFSTVSVRRRMCAWRAL